MRCGVTGEGFLPYCFSLCTDSILEAANAHDGIQESTFG